MPDIQEQQITVIPQRSPLRTRLRPTTLMARMPAYRGYTLRRRRRALAKEINTLDALIIDRKREQSELRAQVELANSHRLDDQRRERDLTQLIRDTATRSFEEQETGTESGRRYIEALRQRNELLVNRPYDNESITRLEAEYRPIHRTIVDTTQALIRPLHEERALANRNHDQGFRTYYSLDQRLINISRLINDLEVARADLAIQSDALNTGHGRKKQDTKAKRRIKRRTKRRT